MTVLYSAFQMPEKIHVEQDPENVNYAKFTAEAFERGYGHTIGSALRRILLTSIESPSIVSIYIEKVPHEFTAIEGVIEDMTNIILNLKGALLRYIPHEGEENAKGIKLITKILEITEDDIEKASGNYKVTLKDIMGPSNFELVNPDLYIFTAVVPMTKRIDIKIAIGRGYIPSERHDFEKKMDEIVVDSAFSPVILVNYWVENTRVGQHIDYDRLILEVKTDGRISPQEALTFASQLALKHFYVFEKIKTHKLIFEEKQKEENKDREDLLAKLALKINEIELSVRSTNCLASAHIETIGELVVMPEQSMLQFRNFGKKSLTEIKEKLTEMGLSLGMDLSKYGINQDNIKSVIQKYLEEKKENEQ